MKIFVGDAKVLKEALSKYMFTVTVDSPIKGSLLTITKQQHPCLMHELTAPAVSIIQAVGVSKVNVSNLGCLLALSGDKQFPEYFWEAVSVEDYSSAFSLNPRIGSFTVVELYSKLQSFLEKFFSEAEEIIDLKNLVTTFRQLHNMPRVICSGASMCENKSCGSYKFHEFSSPCAPSFCRILKQTVFCKEIRWY